MSENREISVQRTLASTLARELEPLEMDLISGAGATGGCFCGASDGNPCDLDTPDDWDGPPDDSGGFGGGP